jgi:hypothetical protein
MALLAGMATDCIAVCTYDMYGCLDVDLNARVIGQKAE